MSGARPSRSRSGRAPARRTPPVRVDRRILERRRKVRAEAARRRRRVTLSVLTLAVLAGAAWGVSRSPLFAVGEVRVTGLPGDRAAEVLQVAGVDTGGNLLDVDTAAVAERVESLPWVRAADVRRLPGVVELRVRARVPAAVVRLAGATWTLDADGWVMGGGGADGLVLVDAPDAVLPPVGERVSDPGIRNALAVHVALPERLRAMVDRYHAPSARGLRLHLAGPPVEGDGPPAPGVWVRFGVAERVETKARVVELLLGQAREQAAQEGRPVPEGHLPPGIAELDVRAPDNPVLVPTGAHA